MYNLDSIRFEDIFAGAPPTFAETSSKRAILNKSKKGQFTLDGWIKDEKNAQAVAKAKPSAASQAPKPAPKPAPPKLEVKKKTPEEIEADLIR